MLRAARTPLSCQDIAEKIRAGGYKTSSENFTDIVKKRLHEMDDVSFTRGQGYRLAVDAGTWAMLEIRASGTPKKLLADFKIRAG